MCDVNTYWTSLSILNFWDEHKIYFRQSQSLSVFDMQSIIPNVISQYMVLVGASGVMSMGATIMYLFVI